MVRLTLEHTDKLKLKHRCDYLKYPFEFSETHVVELPNGDEYIIPKGTKFDFASIPMPVMWLFNKRSQAKRAVAYAVHDAMYISRYRGRKYADDLMLEIMNKLTPKSHFANRIQWFFVRIFGSIYWLT